MCITVSYLNFVEEVDSRVYTDKSSIQCLLDVANFVRLNQSDPDSLVQYFVFVNNLVSTKNVHYYYFSFPGMIST